MLFPNLSTKNSYVSDIQAILSHTDFNFSSFQTVFAMYFGYNEEGDWDLIKSKLGISWGSFIHYDDNVSKRATNNQLKRILKAILELPMHYFNN